ncbi:hypothetical protein [Sphingomonas sp. 1P08PE]|uniref:hypothetical protein n=1 Tax=Sphingomonas sp. 1P08PE TaxID=554122 RepID=UPI00399F2FFB
MRRPYPPLFLPGPTRLAALGRRRALIVMAAAAIVCLFAALLPAPDPEPHLSRQIAFHGAIADRMRRGGEDYYTATAAALRGSDMALRPFTAFPPPITATVVAILSVALPAFMMAIAAGAAAIWSARLSPSRPPHRACMAIAIAGTVAATWSGALVLPPLWSGLFIALSLALRRPGRWIDSVAVALAAAIIHEAAILYLVLMAVLAWRERARREAAGWLGAMMLAAVVIGLHAHAATNATGLFDATSGWTPAGPLGAIAALKAATGASLLPAGLATALVLLPVGGWAMWRHPAATRAFATILACLVLLAVLPATQVAVALLIVPLLFLGLLPAVDAVRDLIAAVLDTRRITVTRVVR